MRSALNVKMGIRQSTKVRSALTVEKKRYGMFKATKTKKEIEREIALTGTYEPMFQKGDRLLSLRLKTLNGVKRPNILEIKRVIHPMGDGVPSYRIWSQKEGKHHSMLCTDVDLKYRKMSDLEKAAFLD